MGFGYEQKQQKDLEYAMGLRYMYSMKSYQEKVNLGEEKKSDNHYVLIMYCHMKEKIILISIKIDHKESKKKSAKKSDVVYFLNTLILKFHRFYLFYYFIYIMIYELLNHVRS